jgi:p-aminobenzoyl-glutamate transporter AbgT
VPVPFSLFTVGGVAYGIKVRTIKRADDIIGHMADAMKRMGPFIVLVLVIPCCPTCCPMPTSCSSGVSSCS